MLDPTATLGPRHAFASPPHGPSLAFTIAKRDGAYDWTVQSGDGELVGHGRAPSRLLARFSVQRLWPDAVPRVAPPLALYRKLRRAWRAL
jgi:hypothetical protein